MVFSFLSHSSSVEIFSYWQAAPRLISPHHRHNLPFLSPRNILERILNLIHPHREKVDVHPASDDVIFRGAVSYTSFYRYHYPFEVFHQATFSLWSSLLGCWLPRFYGIACLMDLPLCTCLACHIIRSISVMVTRTGHTRGLPQMYYIWVTSQWRHSYLACWRFILYLFLFTPQCVTTTAPSSSCFRIIASAFLIISVARQHSGLYKRRHKAQNIHYINVKILSSSLVLPAAYCVYDATPLPSPPLPADRAYLSIGLASTRGVLVFPPLLRACSWILGLVL